MRRPTMESVRKGLRAGDIEKDTYGRLECAACGTQLGRRDSDEEVGAVRLCADCGREWKQL